MLIKKMKGLFSDKQDRFFYKNIPKIKTKHGITLLHKDTKRDFQLYLMLLVPIVYYLIFHYIPIYGLMVAFKDYNIFDGIFASKWVGFDVFKEIFRMKPFFNAVRNTLMLNLIGMVFGFPVPIILALMLNELKNLKFSRTLQSVLYLPHFISWPIIGGIMYQLLSTKYGIVNNVLDSIGMPAISFLTNKYWWVATYIAIGVWQSAGWGAIIFLAAIAGINTEILNAAIVDGCGKLRLIWNIIIPSIKPTIVIMLILSIGRISTIGFDQPYVLGNVLVEEYSDVISTFVYRVGIKSVRFSVASAVGLFQSVISFVMLLSANFAAKKLGEDGLW